LKIESTDGKLTLIGAWSGRVTHYKIFGASIISLERLNLKLSNFVHKSAMSILATYHQQKGRGYGHSFQETLPRKTAEKTVKHHNGGVSSVVANHRSGGKISLVVCQRQLSYLFIF